MVETAVDDVSQDPWFGWNPYKRNSATRDNPYPTFNRLRENHPVHVTPEGLWRVFRHEDVTRILRDLKGGVRTTEGKLLELDERDGPRLFMLHQDPPNHTRLRRLVSRGFTPPAIERMRGHVEQLVDGMLDEVAARGEMDVIKDLAMPLPSTVICEMLGVPLVDREKFTEWTTLITNLLAPHLISPEKKQRAIEAALAMADYMVKLIESRRRELGDDLLSVLIQGEEDDRLSSEEMITQSMGLLIAGFETTIGLIGNGMRLLVTHPEQLQKLKRNPALRVGAVEECLRMEGPVVATRRVLHEDAVIGGQLIPKNELILLNIASAHRDPRVFERPDEFDIERSTNGNLAFGGGIHFCLGAHLARLEGQIAIGKLVERFDELELATHDFRWSESLFRVMGSLPIRFRPER